MKHRAKTNKKAIGGQALLAITPMPQSKYSQNLIKLKCQSCKRINYYTRKNVKLTERKIELKKYCKWCRVHKIHKEAKK